MQDASGFLASDGRFFFDAEECRQYESELARESGIRDRCRALIDAVRVGALNNIPECIGEQLSDPEDWLEEAWNEVIIPLLVPSGCDAGVSAATPSGFKIFERKLDFVRLVVCYALEGSA